MKSYNQEVTDFHDNEMTKAGSNLVTCLEVITINFAFENEENYYAQVLLKECKYIEIKKGYTYY